MWVERDGDELALVEKTIARLREDRDLEVITSDDYKAMMATLVETRKSLQGNSGLTSGWVEKPTGRTISAAYRDWATPEDKRSVLLAGGWSFIVKSVETEKRSVVTVHALKGGKQYGWTGI